ncbi:pilus assembly protein PilP, partial [Zoogloea sp.]|uniref:pilus assembly protein PilP n=1 Tax=Zoogloea sp. TaxID=49181 RepID=UPI00262265A2
MSKKAAFLLPLALSVSLAACSDEQQDMRAWMNEASRDLKPNLRPLPPIQQGEEVAYDAAGLVDPFRPAKLEPDKKSNQFIPDANRRKEPLEAYPLESLKMVGVLLKGGQAHAIVAMDKTLHQVRVGNYLGQNYGQVTAINETA